jgi:hypothetical protein
MRRNSSDRDRPILVIPRKARIETPDAPASSSSASITIHASADPEARDGVRATGKRRGEAAEAAFLARATHLGFGVLVPWGESRPYDAAVDCGRGLLRVQVKSAGSFNAGLHVLQLLNLFLLAPQIEIIETTLPESTGELAARKFACGLSPAGNAKSRGPARRQGTATLRFGIDYRQDPVLAFPCLGPFPAAILPAPQVGLSGCHEKDFVSTTWTHVRAPAVDLPEGGLP